MVSIQQSCVYIISGSHRKTRNDLGPMPMKITVIQL